MVFFYTFRNTEKKKQLPQRRMNNVNGRNVMTVNQMQRHHYNPQPSVCPPMQLKNSSGMIILHNFQCLNLLLFITYL